MTDTILLTVPLVSVAPASSRSCSAASARGSICPSTGSTSSRSRPRRCAPSVQADALELEADVLDDRLVVRIGPLEDGTDADAALRRVVDALVDGVAGIREGDHEWLELELVRSEAG